MALEPENVWDYPRPPRLEPVRERLLVTALGVVVADTTAGYRVLETSHPPTYYIPPADIRMDLLKPEPGGSFCEFKGRARYWSIITDGGTIPRAAWSYADPTPAYAALRDCVSFYASRVVTCRVGDEEVIAQAGDFYGGWITANLTGPFKGVPGSSHW